MQPPFQARTHALRMRPIHLMHRYRYLSLATEFLHARLRRCQCPLQLEEAAPGIEARQLFLPLSEVSVRRGICSGECHLPWHT